MYRVTEIRIGAGLAGIGPLPGRGGDFAGDLAAIIAWGPDLVLTLVTVAELDASAALGAAIEARGIAWQHWPITDFGTPAPQAGWRSISSECQAILARGGRLFVHCMGGCGRSGMVLMRLMVEAGEGPEAALARLRAARPCAVETEAQRLWASGPSLGV